MDTSKFYDDFVVAYNNFNFRALIGESMKKFFVNDKFLIIGERGCGKSTILNKVTEEIKDKYHVVTFSAIDELNLGD
ncbi:MAG TPA: hypothetical protein VJL89_03070 [Thermodesulfovibrionia bacterium]|nr:hypothetical protein [Thermodesulfovibrionia bacterium]